MERLRKTARAVLVGVVLAGLFLLAVFLGLAWQVDRYGQVDRAQAADAIIILGARVEQGGQPGSDLLSRTYHAVDLYQAGYAQHVICTGGYADDWYAAAAVACRFAVQRGVPREQVWLADGTWDTEGDAASAAAIMRQQGWDSAILVSHPLHLYRAAWHFQSQGITVYPSATTTEVARIMLPLRAFYVAREAAAILWQQALRLGAPREWEQEFRVWWYDVSRRVFGETL